MTSDNGGDKGNQTAGLAKLLNQLNLPTLMAILVATGGNWWETKVGNDLNVREIERAIEEVHQLYPKLNEAIDRQRQIQQQINEINQKIQR